LPLLAPYVEPLSDARTPLGDFFSILREREERDAKKGLWVDPTPIPPWEWRKR